MNCKPIHLPVRTFALLLSLVFCYPLVSHGQDSLNVSLTGGLFEDWAHANDVCLVDSHALITTHTGFIIFDVSNPADPQFESNVIGLEGADRLAIDDGYAYIIDQSGLHIYDLADFQQPALIGSLTDISDPIDIAVQHDLACVLYNDVGFCMVDVSNPANPVFASPLVFQAAAASLDFVGNNVILSTINGLLHVYDVSNLNNLVETGSVECDGWACDLSVQGNFAYGATWQNGVFVVEFSDPTDPQVVATVNTHGETVLNICCNGDDAYACTYADLYVLDIQNPEETSIVRIIETQLGSRSACAADNHLFIAEEAPALQVYDVAIPTQPNLVGLVVNPSSLISTAVNEDIAYLLDSRGLFIVNLEDPAEPALISTFNAMNSFVPHHSFLSVVYDDDLLFIPDDSVHGTVYVVDVSDPAVPTSLSCYTNSTARTFSGLTLHNGLLYAADWIFGLFILDPSDPENLTQVASINPGNMPLNVACNGNFAYTLGNHGEIAVINITDPGNPTPAGSYEVEDDMGVPRNIVFDGDYAYVASVNMDDLFLLIFDISNPDDLELLTSIPFTSGHASMDFHAPYLYLAAGSEGTQIWDMSDPTSPELAGYYNQYLIDRCATLIGNHVLVRHQTTISILDPSAALSVDETAFAEHPTRFTLSPVYPNPFNAIATTTLTIPSAGEVRVTLFNALGQHVLTVADGPLPAGTHSFAIDATQLASGIYLLRASFPEGVVASRKITLVK